MITVPMADLSAQHRALRGELTAAFEGVLATGQFIGGESVQRLEDEVAALCGAAEGVGVNSGTDALLLALKAAGVGPGDEVITTPFTFGATAETIRLAGATPVFADIDPRTFNLDPGRAAAKITARTKALMPVHLFGQAADMAAFGRLAKQHGLPVIADAAQAVGAAYQGRPIGAWADLSTLSFYPTKNLGACGDGGLILTDDAAHATHLRRLRNHGMSRYSYYEEIGYCSRLDGLQAALLRVKLPHLHDWNEARRKNAALYDERLGGLDGRLVLPSAAAGCRHIYHQYTVRVLEGKRDALHKHLASHGVASAVYYPLALHLQPPYADLGYRAGDLPESERATAEVLSLPVHPDLRISQIEHVARTVRAFFG